MLERERLESKKISKTNAVTSMLDYEIDPDDVHVGPSDHVPWLLDRKWCYIRMEGTTYGDVPLNAELKLEVWDSPNSAGVITDAIRCLKLGLDRGLKGTLVAPSSYFMKSPPHPDPRRHRVQPRRGVHPRRRQRDARRDRGAGQEDRQADGRAPRPRWPPPRGDRRRTTSRGAAPARGRQPEDRGAVGRRSATASPPGCSGRCPPGRPARCWASGRRPPTCSGRPSAPGRTGTSGTSWGCRRTIRGSGGVALRAYREYGPLPRRADARPVHAGGRGHRAHGAARPGGDPAHPRRRRPTAGSS